MKTNRKTLKGTVLFTVVSVLSLLIIFLTSALVLASAANNRAHKSYSSSQVSYTARSAIDSVLAAVSYNADFSSAVANLDASSTPITVSVDMNNPGMGHIDSATLSYAGTRKMYNPDEDKWEDKKLIAITANVGLSSESVTLTSYVVVDATYNPGSKVENIPFQVAGDATMSNHTSSMGGMYIGVGANSQSYHYIDVAPNGDPITLEDKQYLSGRTYGWSNGTLIEAPMVIDGNLDIGNDGAKTEIYIQKASTSGDGIGGIQIWGDLAVGSDFSIDSTLLKHDSKNYAFNEIPYLYVDGVFNCTNKATIGNGDMPLNVFCGSMKHGSNELNFYGNLYCMDENATTELGGTQNNLYVWAASIAESKPAMNYFGGNIYTKGNLILGTNSTTSALNYANDIRVGGDLTLNADVNIKGDLVVKGRIITNGHNINANSVTVGKNKLKDNVTATSTVTESLKNPNYILGTNVMWTTGTNSWDVSNNFPYALLDKSVLSTAESYTKTSAAGAFIETYDFAGNSGKFINPGNPSSQPSCVVKTDWNPISASEYTTTTTTVTYTDDAGNEISLDDAYVFDASVQVGGKTPIQYVNQMIYPGYAERDVIMGLKQYTDEAGVTYPIEQTQIFKTVREVWQQWGLDNSATSTTTDWANRKATLAMNTISSVADYEDTYDANGETAITQDCILTGDWDGTDPNLKYKKKDASGNETEDTSLAGTIVIKAPIGQDLYIGLENFKCSNGVKLLIDDSDPTRGDVNFYVYHDATKTEDVLFGGNGSYIATKSINDILRSGQTYEAWSDQSLRTGTADVDLPAPRVYMFSDPNAVMRTGNMFYITAYVQAPNMKYDCGDSALEGAASRLIYDGIKISDTERKGDVTRVTAFGKLNVNGSDLGNNGIVVYMNNSSGGGGGGGSYTYDINGEHAYQAVEYVCN